jgi:ankyrin repeat protein
MCSWYSTYTRHAFTYLVNRGANVNVRDNAGATCLHLAIENAKRPLSGELEALMYLFDQGADVHATTAEGISVSEVAYTTSSTDVVYKLGSYRGDLWDAVLAGAGHDVVKFRRGWPRQEKFTAQYTLSHFQELWEGQEHLCPYFHSRYIQEAAFLETSDGATTEAAATVPNVRSFEASIRQRTDISVTIDSLDSLNSNTQNQEQYDQYEGSCVASHSLSEAPPVPLLWDPSLAHHLMPNPWHDIIPQDSEPMRVESQVSGKSTSTASVADETANVESQGVKRSNNDETSGPIWRDIEMENVWSD